MKPDIDGTMEFIDAHYKGTKLPAKSFDGVISDDAKENGVGPDRCVKCNNGWCGVSQRKRE